MALSEKYDESTIQDGILDGTLNTDLGCIISKQKGCMVISGEV